ncbi:MAG: hypothetical protein Q8941_14095 [Bacteroidota bacterium]|nr:hypothetical protein [Bacteroidota bacterium]
MYANNINYGSLPQEKKLLESFFNEDGLPGILYTGAKAMTHLAFH